MILSGIKRPSPEWQAIGEWAEGISNLRNYHLLDDAIEWAEDQVVYRHGGAIDSVEMTELSEQALLAGLTAEELAELAALGHDREPIRPGRRIIAADEPPASLFFLRSGVVHVKLPERHPARDAHRRNGVRRNGAAGNAPLRRRAGRQVRHRPRSAAGAISSAFASSIRGPANGSCAISRSCSPTA